MAPHLPDGVEHETDGHGLARLRIAAAEAEAVVYFQGAHVTHYRPRGAAPVLFTSAESRFAPGQPIRGGVPLIFPWFGPHPTDPAAPAHGFARLREWALHDVLRDEGSVTATFLLAEERAFELLFAVTVGQTLGLSLRVSNRSAAPMTFEEALHTYLAVADVRAVVVEGLSGREYLDKVDGMRRKTQSGPVKITGETDRVYLNTPDAVTVHDPGAGRRLTVTKEDSASTVVWNPWVEKAKKLPDFGDDEWPRMLCVETANVAQNAVTLAPGESHVMRAAVRLDDSDR